MIFQYQIVIWFKPKRHWYLHHLLCLFYMLLLFYTLLNNIALIFSLAYTVFYFFFFSGNDVSSSFQMRLCTTSFKSVMNI